MYDVDPHVEIMNKYWTENIVSKQIVKKTVYQSLTFVELTICIMCNLVIKCNDWGFVFVQENVSITNHIKAPQGCSMPSTVRNALSTDIALRDIIHYEFICTGSMQDIE